MHLIFIYGPPASGKLTIAQELKKLTGYRLLENNITNLPVLEVFPFGSRPFGRIVGAFRLSIFREAALHNIDLITTYVYAADEGEDYLKAVINEVSSNGGSVEFVRITCPMEELLRRAGNDSRMQGGKLVDTDQMKELLSKSNLDSSIPFVESFVIDSSKQTAEESAKMISNHISAV